MSLIEEMFEPRIVKIFYLINYCLIQKQQQCWKKIILRIWNKNAGTLHYPVVYWNIILNFLFACSEKGTKQEKMLGRSVTTHKEPFISYCQCLVSILKGKKYLSYCKQNSPGKSNSLYFSKVLHQNITFWFGWQPSNL